MSEEIEVKYAFQEMLDLLDRFDAGEAIAPEIIVAIGKQIVSKVDAIRFAIDDLYGRAEIQRKYSREFAEEARILESKAERLRFRVASAMESSGIDKIPGEKFTMSFKKSFETEIIEKVTDAWREKFPHFVRAKYEWDKEAIRPALDAGEKFMFADLKKNIYPAFSVKRKE